MEYRGRSHGALGVVNAIGSGGYGAAVALDLPVEVVVRVVEGVWEGVVRTRGVSRRVDPSLLQAVAWAVSRLGGCRVPGLSVEGASEVPYAAGLKGSSALIDAILDALLGYCGVEVGVYERALLGVAAARRAGLTVTGALDDHLAVAGCGAYATINPSSLVRHDPCMGGGVYVGVVVPGSLEIGRVRAEVYRRFRPLYMAAWRLAVEGLWWDAAVVNGAAGLLSLGIDPGEVYSRLRGYDLLAVGVTGKGPGVYTVSESARTAEEAAKSLAELLGGYVFTVKPLPCGDEELCRARQSSG